MLHEYDPAGAYAAKLEPNSCGSVRGMKRIKILGREFNLCSYLDVVEYPPFEVFITEVSIETANCDNRFDLFETKALEFARRVFPGITYPTLRWVGRTESESRANYREYKDFILMDLLFS